MWRLFARSFGEYREFGSRVVLSQLFLLVAAIGQVVVATMNRSVFDDGVAKGDTDTVVTLGIWMLVIALVAAGFQIANGYFAVFFSQGTAWVLRTKTYRHIQSFTFENLDRFSTSNLLVRLNADVMNVMWAVLFAAMLLLYAVFMLLAALVATAFTAPSLLWVLVVVIVLVVAITSVVSPRLDRAYTARQLALDDVNGRLRENLSGVRVVKAFVREDLEEQRFADATTQMRHPAFRAAFWMAVLTPLLTTLTQAGMIVAVWVGGEDILGGSLQVGTLVAFVQYLILVITPLALLAVVMPSIQRGRTSLERIVEIMDTVPTLEEPSAAAALPAETARGEVVFDAVTFAYRRPSGELDPPVLRDISLRIPGGSRVGILGSTGSGKTTLVNLISRFYDPTEGRVLIDGVDVRDLDREQLTTLVGVALQEAVLFQGDLRFNLKFGAPDVDDEVMVDAARAADALEFVEHLPERWDAPVSRRGYNFSGGQRQRLNIARALTPGPRVLILDDSTSAVDVTTEARIQEAIPELTAGATTIYVAQRISAVIDLDMIVLLDGGVVAAVGNHEELLASSALYQEIFESQLGAGVVPAGTEVVR